MKEFTKREKEILDKISNIQDLRNIPIDNLCKELKTGYSTIYSIINKNNYNGYKDMINDLANKKKIYAKADSNEDRLKFDYKEFVNAFFESINNKQVKDFLSICKKSKKIFVLGKDHSSVLAQKYALDLNRIGISAFALENNYDAMMLKIKNMNQNDLVLVLSASAKTDWIFDAIELMKTLNIDYILLIGNSSEIMEKNSKLTIYLPTRKTLNITSKISNFVPYLLFLDLLWAESNE